MALGFAWLSREDAPSGLRWSGMGTPLPFCLLKKRTLPISQQPAAIPTHGKPTSPSGATCPPAPALPSSPDPCWEAYLVNMAPINTPNVNGWNIFKDITPVFRNRHGLIEVVLPICSGSGGMQSLY